MLLNLVGITLVMVSGIGLAVYEEPERGYTGFIELIRYNVDFNPDRITGPQELGELNDGDQTTEGIEIEDYNITDIEFRVVWDDNYLFNRLGTANIRITITSPDGDMTESFQDSGRGGTLIFEFTEINMIPNSTEKEVEADLDAGEVIYEDYPPGEKGIGTWQVEISVSRSPRSTFTGTVDYNIITSYKIYSLEITEENGSGE
jgi:hypothetical protein